MHGIRVMMAVTVKRTREDAGEGVTWGAMRYRGLAVVQLGNLGDGRLPLLPVQDLQLCACTRK